MDEIDKGAHTLMINMTKQFHSNAALPNILHANFCGRHLFLTKPRHSGTHISYMFDHNSISNIIASHV